MAPSSSGFYKTTVQATNAPGALSQQQGQQFASQVQQFLASNGINTGVTFAGQSVNSTTSTSGRRHILQTVGLSSLLFTASTVWKSLQARLALTVLPHKDAP